MKKEAIVKFYLDFKLYIFPVIVSLACLFLIIFAIYPQTAKLIDNQKSADGLMNKSTLLETKVAALESFNEEDLSQKVEFALTSLPGEKDFGNIFGLLQRIISGSGFSITTISLSTGGTKIGNSESYEVKLEIRGTKATFPILLSNLENSPRLIRIKSIDVSSRPSDQSMDVSLVVGVLYSSVPQSFGTTDSPLPQLSEQDEEILALLADQNVSFQVSVDSQSSSKGKSNPFD